MRTRSRIEYTAGERIGPRFTTFEGWPVVAVIGEAGDWAAYRGQAGWTIDMIARQGDKISWPEARAMFPEIARSGLRWRD